MDNIWAGGEQYVHCREVVPSSEIEMYGQHGRGAHYNPPP